MSLTNYNENGEYTVEDGLLKPQYSDFNFHRLELKTGLYLPMFDSHTFNTTIRLGFNSRTTTAGLF